MHTDGRGSTCGWKFHAKGTNRKLNCRSLCVEIQRMWNVNCLIIPVITGATGVVTEDLKNNLEAIPGKYSVDSLQKTAMLGTSHLTRKYCSLKVEA